MRIDVMIHSSRAVQISWELGAGLDFIRSSSLPFFNEGLVVSTDSGAPHYFLRDYRDIDSLGTASRLALCPPSRRLFCPNTAICGSSGTEGVF